MVVFVRHRQVDDGQHHEDEGLQGDDQDVGTQPTPSSGYAQGTQQEHSATEHDGDQNEDQFAGIHVAEQTQRQRNRLGDQGHELEQEVHRNQQDLNDDVLAAEGVQGQFTEEAADALDLDAVKTISANTEIDRPRVAFGSVVATARKNRCSSPVIFAASIGR